MNNRPATALRLLAIAVLIVTPATRSLAGNPPLRRQENSYQALVEQYRAGKWDAAVAELAAWEPARVQREAKPPPEETTATLASVALLHTEAILRGASLDAHLKPARRAVNGLRTRAEARAFVLSWRIVVNSWLVYAFRFSDARRLLSAQNWEPSAETLLAYGSIFESEVARPVRIVDSSVTRTSGPRWEHAEEKYKEALRLDPTLVEARLRLGRVLFLRGFPDEALPHLERARREAPPGFLAYLAALFLGAVHEQKQSFDAAAECYQAAIAEYPEAQAAYVALGHVLQRSGRPDAEWAAVRRMFGDQAAPRNPERDPWWVYFDAQFWQITARIDSMRHLIRP